MKSSHWILVVLQEKVCPLVLGPLHLFLTCSSWCTFQDWLHAAAGNFLTVLGKLWGARGAQRPPLSLTGKSPPDGGRVVYLHASPLIWHRLGKRLVSKKVHWKTCNPVQFFGNDKTWRSLISQSQAWFKGLHWQDIIVEKLYFLLLYLFFKTLQW